MFRVIYLIANFIISSIIRHGWSLVRDAYLAMAPRWRTSMTRRNGPPAGCGPSTYTPRSLKPRATTDRPWWLWILPQRRGAGYEDVGTTREILAILLLLSGSVILVLDRLSRTTRGYLAGRQKQEILWFLWFLRFLFFVVVVPFQWRPWQSGMLVDFGAVHRNRVPLNGRWRFPCLVTSWDSKWRATVFNRLIRVPLSSSFSDGFARWAQTGSPVSINYPLLYHITWQLIASKHQSHPFFGFTVQPSNFRMAGYVRVKWH